MAVQLSFSFFATYRLQILLNMFTTNNKLLNLGGTFIDLENFGVTHQFLNWIFTVETITTVDLNGISCVLICSITSKELEM